ncbi:MAG TPA: OsmC family protein [Acidimicrobiales bacterium]|nr:OsmC family protein [Acidimicrobiales bacterium]
MVVAAHVYRLGTTWTGDLGAGTAGYGTYSRDFSIECPGKPVLFGSADPGFRGDAGRYNPEELLLAALSSCHLLWYLHLCADAGVVVRSYRDAASGTMETAPDGGGAFTEVTLRPEVGLEDAQRVDHALRLHDAAHDRCFIARSMNFPVRCEPRCVVWGG